MDAVITSQGGKSALHIAVDRDKSTLVQKFVVARANPLLQDEYKWAPVHYASVYGFPDVLEALCETSERVVTQKLEDRPAQFTGAPENCTGEVPQRIHKILRFGLKVFFECASHWYFD